MDELGYSKWSCKEREKERYNLGNDDLRRWYQRDIDQITHSTGFRKLQHKSQLLSEKDPRSRSRMIHTIEVSRIATEICEKLGASKELAEAISYAHDIATAPYGYIGNAYLCEKVGSDYSHEKAGALQLLNLSKKLIVDDDARCNQIEEQLEKGANMQDAKINVSPCSFLLNVSKSVYNEGEDTERIDYYIHQISPEIIDGVLNHGANGEPSTIEGQILQMADNIAYLSQDIEDLLSAKIVRKDELRRQAARPLTYKKEGDSHKVTWEQIDAHSDWGSLQDAFNITRGRRIAALIQRYVNYNLELLKDEKKLKYRYSDILKKDIPVLQVDSGMEEVINAIWYYIETKYDDNLIRTSNNLQKQKMEELWEILSDNRFASKNNSYKKFIDSISVNTLFSDYDDNWKKAYFISHLSYPEVDLIINSFHERNYTFEIDIEEV